MSRPLVVYTLCLILGILLGGFLPLSPMILYEILILILFILLLVHFNVGRDISLWLLMIFILLGITRYRQAGEMRFRHFQEIAQYTDNPELIISGRIFSNPTISNQKKTYILDHVQISSDTGFRKISGRLLVELKNPKDNTLFWNGDNITLMGRVNIFLGPTNPDAFNYRSYWMNRGVVGMVNARAEDVQSLPPQDSIPILTPVSRFGSIVKYRFYKITNTLIPTPYSALVNGISLGVQSDIPDEIRDVYIKGGIYHLLVVSGSNVMMIAYILFLLLRLFRCKRRWAAVISIPLVIFYALIVGPEPPIIRATIMGVLVLLGMVLRKDVQIINSLALAAFIILLMNPMILFDTSFQLSYMAVLGIAILYPIFVGIKTFRPRFIQNITYGTLSATIFSGPLLIKYFNMLSWIAILTNMLAVNLVFCSLPITFLTGILYPLFPTIAQYIANTNYGIMYVLTQTTKYFIQFKGAYSYIASPPTWTIALYYIYLVAFIYGFQPTVDAPDYRFRKRWLYSGLSCIIVCILFYGFWKKSDELKFTFLDVGQGDCIFIEFPNDKNMLVDGGSGQFPDKGRQVILPFLHRHGINHINTIVITHPDDDHVGGLVSVIREVSTDLILYNGQSDTTEQAYTRVMTIVNEKEIPCQKVTRGQVVQGFEPCQIQILNPPDILYSGTAADDNNNSIVLRVMYGNQAFLLTGDIQEEVENDLLASGLRVDATLLKVGHHGSKNSTSDNFLTKINPKWVIIQVGRNNRYGMPSFDTINRIRSHGNISIRRTDFGGAVIARTDGKTMDVTSVQETRPIYPITGLIPMDLDSQTSNGIL